MIKVSVMYPNEEGTHFNLDYYRDTHMALVRKHLEPHGLIKTGIDKGMMGGAPGEKSPYHCIGMLYYPSLEVMKKASEAVGSVLREDIPNFTNVTPIRMISEVIE